MTNSTQPQPFVFELEFKLDAQTSAALAYRMLFANLDDHQRAVYAELVRAGVLPAREGDVDAG